MQADKVLAELKDIMVERFGLAMDESQDLARHFESLGTVVAYITSRTGEP